MIGSVLAPLGMWDIAAGFPLPAEMSHIRDTRPLHRTSAQRSRTRSAIESVLIRVLASPRPVYVAFSGGRDSSAVLALAVDVARRHKLELPIPITRQWADVPEVDESEWQERVIRYLGLSDWIKIPMTSEFELLGELTRARLLREGIEWPATAGSNDAFFSHCTGAHLLTGEGGDELLGPLGSRALHHVAGLLRLRGVRRLLPLVWDAVAPRPLRRITYQVRSRVTSLPWLTPVAERFVKVVRRDEWVSGPRHTGKAIARVPLKRSFILGHATLTRIAAARDVELLSPLLTPPVVHALAMDAGYLGWRNRTEATRHVAGDLLPADVLGRSSKVNFAAVAWGPETRTHLARWDGRSGIDPSVVEPTRLVEAWAAPAPDARTALLAQATWLAQNRHG